MNKRLITQEDFDNDNYPECRRCKNYSNEISSIFGDCWTCDKGHSSIVDNNSFDVKETGILEIHDCGDYEKGKPKTYILG